MIKTLAYRPDIDGLRAVAVLSVILYHAVPSALPGGLFGVDIFFVISGFLITRIIKNESESGSFSVTDFYKRRARRILPALFVCSAFSVFGSTIIYSPSDLVKVGGAAVAALFSASNLLFWLNSGYFDASSIQQPLLHTWSLGVEEQFYLFWPVLLALIPKKRALLGIASVACFSLVLTVAYRHHSNMVFYLTPFRVYEFAAGGALCWLIGHSPKRGKYVPALGASIGSVMVSASLLGVVGPWGISPFWAVLGTFLLLYAGSSSVLDFALAHPAVRWIGRLSYSLYLTHWPIFTLTRYETNDVVLNPSELLIASFATFVCAILLHYLVERPFRRPSRDTRRTIRGWLLMAMSICVVGISIVLSGGWQWRLGERADTISTMVEAGQFGGAGCVEIRCENGPQAASKIYLIGDSHARALFSGIVALNPDRHVIFFGSDGCQMYSQTLTARFGNGYDELCNQARSAAFAEMRAKPAPVVLAQNWMSVDLFDNTGASHPTENFWQLISAEIGRMGQSLLIPSIVVVGNVPSAGDVGNSSQCLLRPFPRPSCNSVSIDHPVVAARAKDNELLKAAISKEMTFIDPFVGMCKGALCLVSISGNPLYFDDDHLSVSGSYFLAKAIPVPRL